jgi:ribonuclease P protein component
MLPRRHKLSRKSFPTQYDPKTTWRGDLLLIRLTRTKEIAPPRFAVIVPKKILKLANRRNRVRRIIYNVIREHMSEFSGFIGAKFVITLQKNSVSTIEKETITNEIQKFLSQ